MKMKHLMGPGLLMLVIGLPIATATDTKANWEDRCASCHGAAGQAETKMGKKLKLKDYSDAKVQSELKDDAMLAATLEGVTVDGKEKMKAFKDQLSAAEAKDLVALIRTFKR
jgi:mono/diheme cytochrome c family protein